MNGSARGRRAVVLAALLVFGGLAGCGGGGHDQRVRVAIVSDSEVPQAVADGLDQAAGIHVTSAALHPGWLIAQLDPDLDRALADHPGVIVFSGGANDLRNGPGGIVEALHARFTKAQKVACVVAVIPATDPTQLKPAERALLVNLVGVLTKAVQSWGVRTVSYLDLSTEMRRQGKQFFAGTGLGSFHPGPAAYPLITSALTAAVNACKPIAPPS